MKFILLIITLVECYSLLGNFLVYGDVGTAKSYRPPYLPTRCSGYDSNQFPEDGLFVAASEGIWDNGAACGRRYRLRCISGVKKPCKDGVVMVQVVDVCQACPATLLLSSKAFDAISKFPNAKINVEYAMT